MPKRTCTPDDNRRRRTARINRRTRLAFVGCLLIAVSSTCSKAAEHIVLRIRDAPPHGIVALPVDLTAAAAYCGIPRIEPHWLEAALAGNAQTIAAQFVADHAFDPRENIAGLLFLRLPHAGNVEVQLRVSPRSAETLPAWDGLVSTPAYRVTHSRESMGGLPSRIEFPTTGKRLDSFRWNDRVHLQAQGGFWLRHDKKAIVELIANGPICTVVRVRGVFRTDTEQQPASRPSACYTWVYMRDLPLVYVSGEIEQRDEFTWSELHFLELNFPDSPLPHWAGGQPLQQGELNNSGASHRFPGWAAMHDGRNAIGMLRVGDALVYDGKNGYGKYLHAFGSRTWQPWSERTHRRSAWLWIGTSDNPVADIQSAEATLPTEARATVTAASVNQALTVARAPGRSNSPWWRLAAAEQLEARGRFDEALAAIAGTLPETCRALTAGKMGMLLAKTESGVELLGLYDVNKRQILSTHRGLPIFEITLRHDQTKDEIRVAADAGWGQVTLDEQLNIHWCEPQDRRLAGLQVTARAVADSQAQRVPLVAGSWRSNRSLVIVGSDFSATCGR